MQQFASSRVKRVPLQVFPLPLLIGPAAAVRARNVQAQVHKAESVQTGSPGCRHNPLQAPEAAHRIYPTEIKAKRHFQRQYNANTAQQIQFRKVSACPQAADSPQLCESPAPKTRANTV